MTWQPIETAPKDGRTIKIKVGKYEFAASYDYIGDDDATGLSRFAWQAHDEDEAPPCWDDGVCWGSNANEQASKKPTHWQPLPPPPEKSE